MCYFRVAGHSVLGLCVGPFLHTRVGEGVCSGVGEGLTQLCVVEWGAFKLQKHVLELINAIYGVGKAGKTNEVMRLT